MSSGVVANIFAERHYSEEAERVSALFAEPRYGLRAERILSSGQVSEVLVQEEAELVLLLEGEAELEWERGERFRMRAGDLLWLEAGRPHRVAWTSARCLWFCVFLRPAPDTAAPGAGPGAGG